MTAPFALLEDYIEAFGNSSTATGDSDMQVRAALAAACDDIRSYCAQDFTVIEGDVITVNGTGRSTLLLPQLPVVAVNSVTINAGEDTEEIVTDYRVDKQSGLLFRSRGTNWGSCWWSGVWPRGFLNITIDYDHGFAEIPREIIRAACLMAKQGITVKQVGLASESIAGYSYTSDPVYSIALADAATKTSLEKILNRYRAPRIPVA